MEKMFVYPEILDRTISDARIMNEVELSRSRAGTVSYLCKVYRTRLEQGVASQVRGNEFSSRSRGQIGNRVQA